jgi:hypothetical protein
MIEFGSDEWESRREAKHAVDSMQINRIMVMWRSTTLAFVRILWVSSRFFVCDSNVRVCFCCLTVMFVFVCESCVVALIV